MTKKLLTGIGIGVAVIFLAGCGTKNKTQNNAPASQAGQQASSDSQKPVDGVAPAPPDMSEEKANLPAPSGKVGDALNAIDQEGAREKAESLGDDEDAKSVVNDSQETNDLSNSYDQNEIK